jgi:hypothetical protein
MPYYRISLKAALWICNGIRGRADARNTRLMAGFARREGSRNAAAQVS